jgi:hypothetical protein
MRTRLGLTILLAGVLVGCGGGLPGGPGSTAGASTRQPAGQIDCDDIRSAATKLVMVQLLAQLTTPDTVEAIRTGQVGGLDLDTFLTAMGELHALDSFSSPLGDPKAAIDLYEKAARAAKVLFETEPITQAAIDTYNQNVGTVGDFLGHQIAISGAIEEAGC